jgi:purine-binding chemotaxis protein CheW
MEETSHVLEFRLGSGEYCIDIEYIEEVVEREKNGLTQLPNAEAHVAGVMDLRGETTPIIDPKKLLGLQAENGASRIIVLETENGSQRSVGWLVDEVNEVSTVTEESVENPGEDDDLVRGVINHGDEFVIWVEPE